MSRSRPAPPKPVYAPPPDLGAADERLKELGYDEKTYQEFTTVTTPGDMSAQSRGLPSGGGTKQVRNENADEIEQLIKYRDKFRTTQEKTRTSTPLGRLATIKTGGRGLLENAASKSLLG